MEKTINKPVTKVVDNRTTDVAVLLQQDTTATSVEKEDDIDLEKVSTSCTQIRSVVSDLSLALSTRLRAIEMFYRKYGEDETVEVITAFGIQYLISKVSVLQEYLYGICAPGVHLSALLKSMAAQMLHEGNPSDPSGYDALITVYPDVRSVLGTPYLVGIIKMLLLSKDPKHCQKTLQFMYGILDDAKIDEQYRYKTLLQLEQESPTPTYGDDGKQEPCKPFFHQCLSRILSSPDTVFSVRYRILAAQLLLQKYKPASHEERNHIENILLDFCQSSSVEYNTRADAADVLLLLGTEDVRSKAQRVITALGEPTLEDGKKARQASQTTIYTNRQNVHSGEIEKSVKDILEFLQSRKTDVKVSSCFAKFEAVEKAITTSTTSADHDKVRIALNRISSDRALHTAYNLSLTEILCLVWNYIVGHKNEAELKTRLMEELVDMAGTCSSGYVSRLANTLSGYGDFSIRISFREQIIANVNGRLNARIRKIDDLKLYDKVLSEMTVPSGQYADRKHFLRFFRRELPSLRAEIHQEFKDHVLDTDFDIYFRDALSMYENG